MYYILGPVVAVLISLKYTRYVTTKHQEEYKELLAKVELVEKRNTEMDKEMLQ